MEVRSGIYYGLADTEYRADPALSVSGLKAFSISPAHFKASISFNKKTDALAFGSAFHARVLEPEIFSTKYVAEKVSGRSNAGKARKEEIEASGLTLLSPDDAETLEGMAKAVEDHPVASRLFGGGKSEVSMFHKDPQSGIHLKMRADYWREDISMIVDLKTTELASPRAVQRSVGEYKYHWQAAFYRAGAAQVLGIDPKKVSFTFVFVEKKPPYAISVYATPEDVYEVAERQYRPLLMSYAECLEKSAWPSYPPVIQTLQLPSWAA